jgi:hypothetical protein
LEETGTKEVLGATGACLHLKTVDEIMTDPETKRDFMRRTCANSECRKWLSDLPPIDLGAIRVQTIERIFQPGKPPA